MTLADELKNIRRLRGSSLRDVEKATGISNAYLSQLERGRATNPSPKKLAKLADYYDVGYESLLAAAGYLGRSLPNKKTELVAKRQPHPRSTTPLQQVILNAKLDTDDQKLVADYIAFLQSRRRK